MRAVEESGDDVYARIRAAESAIDRCVASGRRFPAIWADRHGHGLMATLAANRLEALRDVPWYADNAEADVIGDVLQGLPLSVALEAIHPLFPDPDASNPTPLMKWVVRTSSIMQVFRDLRAIMDEAGQ
jgi:hypothetical protein